MNHLPSGWELTELQNIADTQLGKTLSPQAREGPHLYPYLRNKNVRWHGLDLDDLREMHFTSAEQIKYALRSGDLLVCEGGEVGRCAIWRNQQKSIFFQNAIHRVRTKDDITPQWIEYYLRLCAETDGMGDYVAGVTINHLTQSKLRRFKIPLAPSLEQQRIVERIEDLFSRLDAIESNLASLIDKVELLRSAILADGFHANRDLPSHWISVKLGDLGLEVKGQTIPAPEGIYELYSVPAFASGQPERMDGAEIRSGKRIVIPADVLLCKINPRINRVWSVGPADGYLQLASTEYLVLRLYEPKLAQYLCQYLSSPEFRRWIELSAEGATGSHTRAKSGPILQQYVPVAPVAERREIVERNKEGLSRLKALEMDLVSTQERALMVRRSVLTEAFAGRLVPQEQTDEPASALLERIAESRLVKTPRGKARV